MCVERRMCARVLVCFFFGGVSLVASDLSTLHDKGELES